MDMMSYSSHPWIMFSVNWLVIIWSGGGEVCLKLDVQGQEGGRILDVDGQVGGVSWKLFNFDEHYMCIIPNLL